MTHRFLRWNSVEGNSQKLDTLSRLGGGSEVMTHRFSGRRGRTFVGAERILKKARQP